MEKMEGVGDQSRTRCQFKTIHLYRHEKKAKLRRMIIEIQDVIRYLIEFRIDNKENRFLEFLIRNTARIQSRLVSKYTRKYGEFTFGFTFRRLWLHTHRSHKALR
ncbi:hypothetical protein ApAK_03165 [Thermoplasmatales archaeon AK]|nr:hypothetical protein [Thermoplasmatales archaeon AK]